MRTIPFMLKMGESALQLLLPCVETSDRISGGSGRETSDYLTVYDNS